MTSRHSSSVHARNMTGTVSTYAREAGAAVASGPRPEPSADWIGSLPEEVRRAVHASMVRRTCRPGEIIFAAGELSTAIYQIVSGTVRFSDISADGRETLFVICGPGACFGNASAVMGGARVGTAVAEEPTVLDCLSKDAFDRLRDQYPHIDRALVVWAFDHMRLLLSRLQEGQQMDLRRRLAVQIVFLLSYAGLAADGRPRDLLELTQETLAASVGATRQAISKMLQDWSADGIVRYRYGRFQVLDRQRLSAVANSESA